MLAKKQLSYDLVYFDPPYKEQKIVEMMLKLAELSLLNKNAIIVCETDQEANLPDEISGFRWIKKVDYGITQLNIYEFEGGE